MKFGTGMTNNAAPSSFKFGGAPSNTPPLSQEKSSTPIPSSFKFGGAPSNCNTPPPAQEKSSTPACPTSGRTTHNACTIYSCYPLKSEEFEMQNFLNALLK